TRKAPPGVLVVAGASGDLTHRKILPAIAQLCRRRLLPPAFAVVGVARTSMVDDGFRQLMTEAVGDAPPGWGEVVKHSRYVTGDYADTQTFLTLKQVLNEVEADIGVHGNRTYYLATVPAVFDEVSNQLRASGLNRPEHEGTAVRLVIEKPFGRD